MPEPNDARNADVVGAVRLALEGASNEATACAVIAKLCEFAPVTPGDATGPTVLLLDAIRETRGTFTVNDA